MKPLPGEIVVMVVLATVILLAGCTTVDSLAPVTESVPAASSAVTPGIAGTVTPPPTTPACAYPPLNPWIWVPESYSSTRSGTMKLPPPPGTLVSKADLFGTPSLHWEEYE